MNYRPFCLHFCAALILLLGIAASCDQGAQQSTQPLGKDELIEANRKRASRESDLLDEYVERSGRKMLKTSTGLRYMIYATVQSDSAATGDVVGITYTSYLLDSTEVVRTGDKLHYFRVGHDDVISGLHEMATLMARGDSAVVIVPSYLAYGLTGNYPNVPPNAPMLYDICLVDIR